MCIIEGCARPRRKRNWCGAHYQNWYRTGNPVPTIVTYATREDEFAAKTSPSGGCLLWTGYRDAKGYGHIGGGGNYERAHRYAWSRVNGAIPPGMQVDHTCWNKACVAIDHLRLATPSENVRNLDGPQRNNLSTGLRNVYRNGKKYQVAITKDRTRYYLGTFETAERAAEVAERERARLFGEFAGKG